MRKVYQEPLVETFRLVFEGAVCQTGGKAGGSGQPGADFDPDDDDIYDGGDI